MSSGTDSQKRERRHPNRQPVRIGNGLVARGRPAPAWVARRIARLRAKGLSFAAIARRLEEAGVPTAHGGRWRPSTVCQIAERVGDAPVPGLGVPREVVELVERLRGEQGLTLAATAAALNEAGVPSPRSRRWSRSSVSVLLRRAR